jgi:uncharacterized caspase-like protein
MSHRVPALSLSILFALSCPATAGERFAVVVGINDYQRLGKLKTCVADAKALASVLERQAGFGGDQGRVMVLTDRSAKLADVRNAIIRYTSKDNIRPDDTVLVYFSGHGIHVKERDGRNVNYLVPQNGDALRDAQGRVHNAIPLAWVREQLDACPATTKLLILDACHADSETKGIGGIAASLSSAVMLLSCRADQMSHTDPSTGHSHFSLHLLQGLAGPPRHRPPFSRDTQEPRSKSLAQPHGASGGLGFSGPPDAQRTPP